MELPLKILSFLKAASYLLKIHQKRQWNGLYYIYTFMLKLYYILVYLHNSNVGLRFFFVCENCCQYSQWCTFFSFLVVVRKAPAIFLVKLRQIIMEVAQQNFETLVPKFSENCICEIDLSLIILKWVRQTDAMHQSILCCVVSYILQYMSSTFGGMH